MAKVQIKSEKITPFGGIVQVHQRACQVDKDGKAL